LRLEPLERVEILVALPRHLCERIRLLYRLFRTRLRDCPSDLSGIVGHDFAAPSSSSITS
ncbi:MAG: hypothetical protein ACJ743_13025, partial [Gaiellaceae bacterium]